eukprot:scaffold664337_cov66-Prasinocladus_malaysianus.AAC.1
MSTSKQTESLARDEWPHCTAGPWCAGLQVWQQLAKPQAPGVGNPIGPTVGASSRRERQTVMVDTTSVASAKLVSLRAGWTAAMFILASYDINKKGSRFCDR